MAPGLRICIVYDCLYPWTHGGAERWYRTLAEQMAARGHDVTYLTRRQWDDDRPPDIPGVRVVAVSSGGALYDDDGRRRIGPPLAFGAGVLAHLVRNRRSYDIVHVCSFPYFSLLAARLALVATRTSIGVDWFEVWSSSYWREYLGSIGGRIGSFVQWLCARLTPRAFTYSELTSTRLARVRGSRSAIRLTGLYPGPADVVPTLDAPALAMVVYAGRHIPEKRVHVIPPAVMAARALVPDLLATILGDGPERERVRDVVRAVDAEDAVSLPGFVEFSELEATLRRATCLLLPSSREGYGIIQVEAAAFGTPSVLIAGEDNSATELIEPGVNGFVAESADPEVVGKAIVAAHAGGNDLRASTARWFSDNAERLSATSSAEALIAVYESR